MSRTGLSNAGVPESRLSGPGLPEPRLPGTRLSNAGLPGARLSDAGVPCARLRGPRTALRVVPAVRGVALRIPARVRFLLVHLPLQHRSWPSPAPAHTLYLRVSWSWSK
ncbi:hypothetical protein GCM10022222_75740 [Amycolatopsis ultiminotia]|uniref:Uncharacterized protein n=1 Tax=Amycolatopsis ultiminotia TaxID=543629 RepID=A0ABP6YBD4_9PSEU